MILTQSLLPRLSQGDIFRSDWDNSSEPRYGSVVVLTHNCEIEKSDDILIAAFIAREEAGSLWGQLAKNEVYRGWAIIDAESPGYIAFRKLSVVPKTRLAACLNMRMHSMTPDGRDLMALALFAFLRRYMPPEEYDQTREDAG